MSEPIILNAPFFVRFLEAASVGDARGETPQKKTDDSEKKKDD